MDTASRKEINFRTKLVTLCCLCRVRTTCSAQQRSLVINSQNCAKTLLFAELLLEAAGADHVSTARTSRRLHVVHSIHLGIFWRGLQRCRPTIGDHAVSFTQEYVLGFVWSKGLSPRPHHLLAAVATTVGYVRVLPQQTHICMYACISSRHIN
jgi:hypothetical protein